MKNGKYFLKYFLTAGQRKIVEKFWVFFNHCTCTFYPKLPEEHIYIVSLNNMAKNEKSPLQLLMSIATAGPVSRSGDSCWPSSRSCRV